MVSGIFGQRPAIGGIEQGVRLALIVEHDLRQVIARNCRQRNGSICGRTGSLFFPGIPQRQQGKHAACQQDEEKQHPEGTLFCFHGQVLTFCAAARPPRHPQPAGPQAER